MKTKICCFLSILFVLSICAVFVSGNSDTADSAYINSEYCFIDINFNEAKYNEYDFFAIEDDYQLQHFRIFANDFNRDFKGKTVVLTKDINYYGSYGDPYLVKKFKGTFDGKGYSINSLNDGLFEELTGTVLNLNININMTFCCNSVIAKINSGTIFNCNVEGQLIVIILSTGGIAMNNYGSIIDCTFDGSISGINTGGIATNNYGSIFGCVVKGEVASITCAGGIAALNEGTINYCYNYAQISGLASEVHMGGIAGRNLGEILNCSNHGKISSSSATITLHTMGGIAGSTVFNNDGKTASIINCYNKGEIIIGASANATGNSKIYLGGILGSAEAGGSSDSLILKNCYNSANISVAVSGSAGIRRLGHIIGSLTLGDSVNKSITDLFCENDSMPACGNNLSISADMKFNDSYLNDYVTKSSTDSRLLKWQGGGSPDFVPIYNIKFNKDGGEFKDESLLDVFYNFEDVLNNKYYYFSADTAYDLSLLKLEKSGYTFDGWYDEYGYKRETITPQQYDHKIELFAKFSEIPGFEDIKVFNNAEFTFSGEELAFTYAFDPVSDKYNLTVSDGKTEFIVISGIEYSEKIKSSLDEINFFTGEPVIKDADTYKVYFKITRGPTEYKDSFTINVIPATVKITWSGTTSFIYNGEKQSPAIVSAKDISNNKDFSLAEINANIEIKMNGNATDANSYIATASAKNSNYKVDESTKDCLFTINKAKIEGITFAGNEFTYNKEPHSIFVSYNEAKYGTLAVNYTNNGKTDAGTYTVTATVNDANYYYDQVLTATLKINKAKIVGIAFSDAKYVFTYDKTVHNIEVSYNKAEYGELLISYFNNYKTDAGTYNVTATVLETNKNYYYDEELKAILQIDKANISDGHFTLADNTLTYNWSIQGLKVTGATTQFGDTVTITYLYEDQEGNTTGSVINAGTYNVTATIKNPNYIDYKLEAVLKIEKALISVKWQEEVTYTGQNLVLFSYTVYDENGINEISNAELVPPKVMLNGEEAEFKNVGIYTLVFDIYTPNYTIVRINGELTPEFRLKEEVDVEIVRADVVVSLSLSNWEVGAKANTYIFSPFLPDEFDGKTSKVEYKVQGADDSTYSQTVPTQVGKYTIRVTYEQTNNYNGFSKTADFEITVKKVSEGPDSPIDLVLILGCVGGGVAVLLTILIIAIAVNKRRSRFIKLSDKN